MSVPLQSNANGKTAPVVEGEKVEKEKASVLEDDPELAATRVPKEVGTGRRSMTFTDEAQKVILGVRKTVVGITVIAHVSIGVGTEPAEKIKLFDTVPPPFRCALIVSVKPAAHLTESTIGRPIERDAEVEEVVVREKLPTMHGSIDEFFSKINDTLGEVVHPGV